MKRPTIRRKRRSLVRSAFTLMEVMLVLVIIAAIAGLAITNFAGYQDRASLREAQSRVSILKNAVESYKIEMRVYPPDLESLHTKPANADANWMQILKQPPPKDPWGNPYQYTNNGDSFDLRSLGKDGTQSDDDVT